MKKRELIFFAAFATFLSANAQEKQTWSLDDCINYALEKNIQLQQNKISLQESEVDVKTAKAALFPSLSFNTGQNLVNRPYQENSATVSGTEIISSTNKTTYNGSYSLSTQWTLWNGGQRLNNIKQQKKNQEIAELSVAETENTLKEEITKLFLQILYADESVNINKGTLEVSKATYERAKELFNQGSISKADLAQLESQVGNDEYQLVTSESSLRNYKLQLKQMLEHVKSHDYTLIILDEILKGTNSADKLNGSMLVLNELSRHEISGIVATHDLGITKLEETAPDRFTNYCFEIELSEKIRYSYKIRRGVARNMNASYLIETMLNMI